MINKDRFQFMVQDQAMDEEHFHQEVELLYILEGAADINVEKKVSKLGTDDIYVVNANRRHSFRTQDGEIMMLRLLISYQLVTIPTGTWRTAMRFWNIFPPTLCSGPVTCSEMKTLTATRSGYVRSTTISTTIMTSRSA